MKTSHIPERMCVGCRKKAEKSSFIRIVNNNGEISFDLDGKSPGRGAYIHKNKDCFKAALKKRSLDRCLKCKVPDEIYGELELQILEDK